MPTTSTIDATPVLPNETTSWLFRRMPRILLIGGLLGVILYYAIAVNRGVEGHPAPPQTDVLIYMQYARSMAEGHPYAYSSGDLPSTGSTSHLYPAVLAIFYRLGAHGDDLLTVIFAFNALCYLLWLQIFWQVARRVAPRQAVLAAALVLLNGHLLLSAASQTDMALFTVLAWALFAALLHERYRLALLFLILGVFARPEGMLLAVGLAVLGVFQLVRREPDARRILSLAASGIVAVGAVFMLNTGLTGTAQFQSVSQKGYLKIFPLLGALGNSARDFSTLVREILFNVAAAPRQGYFLPVAGGLLAIVGLTGVARITRHAGIVCWWLVCTLAAVGMIAMSDWQGIAADRYFLWLLPTWYLLAACGAGVVSEGCRSLRLFPVLAMLLAGYELAAAPFFASYFAAECVRSQAVVNFSTAVAAQLPPKAAVGVLSDVTIAYKLGQHPVRHLTGITTPVFAQQRDLLCSIETLKHCPEYRFEYLVLMGPEQALCDNVGLLGEQLFSDLDAPSDGYVYALYTARWKTFPTAALLPMDPIVSHAVATLTLVDRLDIGFMPDEHRCRYHVGSRQPDQACRSCVAIREIGGQRITEVGLPVIGWDEFHVHAKFPDHPLRVVMRTMLDATCVMIRSPETFPGEGVHLRSPLQIRPIVNGQTLPVVSLPVNTNSDLFSECILDIPAENITTDPVEIVLAGDHIALAYWFYQ